LSLFADKTLTCRDCGRAFPFTAREQEFYAEKGFNNQPSRCPECRAINKARLNGGAVPTTTTAPTTPSFDRPMYPAVCATCGKATQVPFEPRLGRPVYCRDCFVPRPQSPGGSSDRVPAYGMAGSSGSSDRGSSFGPPNSRERGSSFGSSGSRERGSSYGSSAPRELARSRKSGPITGARIGHRRTTTTTAI